VRDSGSSDVVMMIGDRGEDIRPGGEHQWHSVNRSGVGLWVRGGARGRRAHSLCGHDG
jgi:hypothetical protein